MWEAERHRGVESKERYRQEPGTWTIRDGGRHRKERDRKAQRWEVERGKKKSQNHSQANEETTHGSSQTVLWSNWDTRVSCRFIFTLY